MIILPPQSLGGGYTGVTLSFRTSVRPSVHASRNLVRGITSKMLKLVTSNFIHRSVTLWRSAVYKNHNSIPTIFGVIALCKFKLFDFCPGHNFQSIEASNFKHYIQIDHIKEKCSVLEP